MPLTLSVHSYRNAALAQPLWQQFDRLGGTVGRAPGNDLVLDDPGKYISRQHARIEYRDGAYCLVDVGSNPSLVNERPVGTGRHARLADGDRITIGDYQLVASVRDEAPAAPPLPPSPLQAAPPASDFSGGLGAGLGAGFGAGLPLDPDDSLADASILNVGGDPLNPQFDPLGLNLLGTPAASAPPAPLPAYRGAENDHVPPERAAFPAMAQPLPQPTLPPMPQPVLQPIPQPPAQPFAQPPARPLQAPPPALAIPDDYDPLADFLPPRVQAAPPPPPPPPPSPPAPAAPELAAEQGDATSYAPPAPPVPVASSAPAAPILADSIPAASIPAAPIPAAPVPPAPRTAAEAAADDPVIQALLRGLGLSELHTRRSAEEIAELAGAMLREATAGTMGVLMGRAMTKRESRLNMTMISAQANNPLKFFPDAGSALAQMVNGTMPGYMAPPRAFANAFEDLRAHELATMAGMRAALAGVLKRFDPEAIEARLQEPSVMDKVLASNRKAKMWDRMVELYRQMANEAGDDFHRLFGEAFGAAYEEQIERLRQAQR